MSLATLGLIFAAAGATIASWKLLLMPAALAGLYLAATGLIAPPQSHDDPVLFILLVGELATAMGILARRSLSPQ